MLPSAAAAIGCKSAYHHFSAVSAPFQPWLSQYWHNHADRTGETVPGCGELLCGTSSEVSFPIARKVVIIVDNSLIDGAQEMNIALIKSQADEPDEAALHVIP